MKQEPHLFYKQYWLHLQDTLICYQDNKHLQKGKTTNFLSNFFFVRYTHYSMPHQRICAPIMYLHADSPTTANRCDTNIFETVRYFHFGTFPFRKMESCAFNNCDKHCRVFLQPKISCLMIFNQCSANITNELCSYFFRHDFQFEF